MPLRNAQVLYPVLDSKVRNVTLAYSIEHQDEVSNRNRANNRVGAYARRQLHARSRVMYAPRVTGVLV